jgi:plasmid stabilization system protein ParE
VALTTAIGSLRRDPEAYQLVDSTMRRALLRRFPYAIFFEVGATEIVVYGVFHGARDPQSWRRRRRDT